MSSLRRGLSNRSSYVETEPLMDYQSGNDADLRFVISIDYGTTFTGAAWILTTGRPSQLSEVRVVQIWPEGNESKVPSEITYSPNDGHHWGYGIGDNAFVIRWTKLELPRPKREKALAALADMIEEFGQLDLQSQNVVRNSRHLVKTTLDIVTDYLIEVAEIVRKDITMQRDPETLNRFPIDVVITHPAEWDERAKNTTFKAVNNSFAKVFWESGSIPGHIRMATEPEACAQYAMNEGTGENIYNLRKDECFIVVDAGGGTVDLVAYRVDRVAPNFQVTKVTKVTGAECGATCIDRYFLETFLPDRLGQEDYQKLLALGGNHRGQSHGVLKRGEQIMLGHFLPVKHEFEGPVPEAIGGGDNPLPLPESIGMINRPGIRDGQLIITPGDMEKMFQESVEMTIQLIEEQLLLLARQNTKAIFLSGGFSRSQYLFKRVNGLARSYKLTLLRGQDSWSAVAKGAVLMGLGIGCDRPPEVFKCPYHIGVRLAQRFATYLHDESQRYSDSFDNQKRARDNIKWIVGKEDLVTKDNPIVKTTTVIRKFAPTGNKKGTVVLVRANYSDSGLPPTKFSEQIYGSGTIDLNYNLNDLDDPNKLSPRHLAQMKKEGVYSEANYQTQNACHRVQMELEITVSHETVVAVLRCGRKLNKYGEVLREGIVLSDAWRSVHSTF